MPEREKKASRKLHSCVFINTVYSYNDFQQQIHIDSDIHVIIVMT